MNWAWAASSRRGTSHVKNGTRCQDASRTLLVGPSKNVLILVVSDGAGSAAYGGEGAALACRIVVNAARSHFARTNDLPDEDAVAEWLDEVRDRMESAAKARAALLRDFAATLVCTLVTPAGGLIIHVGDGAAIVRVDGQWQVGSWPESGEYASTTYFLTDDDGPRLRLTPLASVPDAIAVFTDGIERLVLDFARRAPHEPFFERMIKPVAASTAQGRNTGLSEALGRYLDSNAVNERTDDDKTLILAARQ